MSKTIDSSIKLKTIDNQSILEGQNIDLNSLTTNTISSKDNLSIISPLQYTGSTPTNGYFLQTDEDGNATWQPVSGETNTSSNVGTGAGVFKQKTGVDLELRSIIGGTGITQTQNANDITLDLDVDWTNATVNSKTTGIAFASKFCVDNSVVPSLNLGSKVGIQLNGDINGGGELTWLADTNNDGIPEYTMDMTLIDGNTNGFFAMNPRQSDTNNILAYTYTGTNGGVIIWSGRVGISMFTGPQSNSSLALSLTQTLARINRPFNVYPDKTNLRFNITDTNTTISNILTYTGTTPTLGYVLKTDALGNASWSDVDHDALTNFVANEHIDHSTVSLTAGNGISATGLGDLTASRTINLADTTVSAGSYGSSSASPTFTVDAQGRLTTATNVNIDHDALTNFVANEHIDWTNTTEDFKTSGSLDIGNISLIPGTPNTLTGEITYSNKQSFTDLALTTNPIDGGMIMGDASGNMHWMEPRIADVYWEGNTAVTDITTIGVFLKAVVTSGLSTLNPDASGGWDLNGVENRLRYTGLMGGLAHMGATLSINGANAQVYNVYLTKNGTKIPGSLVELATSNASNIISTAIHCITPMVTNDYIELWVTNTTSINNDPIVRSANIFIMLM